MWLKYNKENMPIKHFILTSPVLLTVIWSFQFLVFLFDTNYSHWNAPLCSVFFACIRAFACERDVKSVVHSKFYSDSTTPIYNHLHLQSTFHSGWSKCAFQTFIYRNVECSQLHVDCYSIKQHPTALHMWFPNESEHPLAILSDSCRMGTRPHRFKNNSLLIKVLISP